jgi:hypothetical protein
LSPKEINAQVSLSLTPELAFSAIYPVVPIKRAQSPAEQIQWDVRTHLDGSMTETNTGLDISFLFWEAE